MFLALSRCSLHIVVEWINYQVWNWSIYNFMILWKKKPHQCFVSFHFQRIIFLTTLFTFKEIISNNYVQERISEGIRTCIGEFWKRWVFDLTRSHRKDFKSHSIFKEVNKHLGKMMERELVVICSFLLLPCLCEPVMFLVCVRKDKTASDLWVA